MTAETDSAKALLKELIAIPSFSREEYKTADLLEQHLEKIGVVCERFLNNVWAKGSYWDTRKPTLLLNSHHDTVKPNAGYTRDPFSTDEENGKLYGLGSNDAGGALVTLLYTFLQYKDRDLPYNLLFLASAEEEISGQNGVSAVLDKLPSVDLGIVGEPTEMQMAVAEKGLVVMDCLVKGEAGHAARQNGKNAIMLALQDLQWFADYKFPITSKTLGTVHMSVTMIQAGTQHNVIPDECSYVVDLRTTDAYTNEEAVQIIRDHVSATVTPRSTRLRPSGLPDDHPFLQAAEMLGLETYGSPTMSDQALMPFATIKMGPGRSERSHTADEFIYTKELTDALEGYSKLLETLKELMQ